jgi:serine/threonine protein kinase
MGVVYKAEDIRLHRFVALKFLPDEIGRDPHALGRFQREARAASALSHPNICMIFDVVEEHNQQPVIVMELLEGQSVKDKIRAGLFSVDELLHFAIQTSDALDAAHAKGNHPPGHQARQSLRHPARGCQDSRLRPGDARSGSGQPHQ